MLILGPRDERKVCLFTLRKTCVEWTDINTIAILIDRHSIYLVCVWMGKKNSSPVEWDRWKKERKRNTLLVHFNRFVCVSSHRQWFTANWISLKKKNNQKEEVEEIHQFWAACVNFVLRIMCYLAPFMDSGYRRKKSPVIRRISCISRY